MEEPRAGLRGDVNDMEAKGAEAAPSIDHIASVDGLTTDFALGDDIPTLYSLLSPPPSEQAGVFFSNDLDDVMLESPKLVATHDEHLSRETTFTRGDRRDSGDLRISAAERDRLVAVVEESQASGNVEPSVFGKNDGLDERDELDGGNVLISSSIEVRDDGCSISKISGTKVYDLRRTVEEVHAEIAERTGTASPADVARPDPSACGISPEAYGAKEDEEVTESVQVEDDTSCGAAVHVENDEGSGKHGKNENEPIGGDEVLEGNEKRPEEDIENEGKNFEEMEGVVEIEDEKESDVEVKDKECEETEHAGKNHGGEVSGDNGNGEDSSSNLSGRDDVEQDAVGKVTEEDQDGGNKEDDENEVTAEAPVDEEEKDESLQEKMLEPSAGNAEDDGEDSDDEQCALPFGLKITSVETLVEDEPVDDSPTVGVKSEDFEVEVEHSPSSNGDDGGAEMATEFGDAVTFDEVGTDDLVASFQAFVNKKLAEPDGLPTFPRPSNVARGMLKAPGEKPFYTCHQCDKTFPTKDLFKKHRSRSHQKNFILSVDDIGHQTHCFRCSICSKGFIGKVPLGIHRREKHQITVADEKVCGICYRLFRSAPERFTHEVVDHGLKPGQPHTVAAVAQPLPGSVGVRVRPPHVVNRGVRPSQPMHPDVRPPQLINRMSRPMGNNSFGSVNPPPVYPPVIGNMVGKISIRPTHTLQGGQRSFAPIIMAPAPAPRTPVFTNGYGRPPRPPQGPGCVLSYVAPPGAPPPLPFMPRPRPTATTPSIFPKTFACATCQSEFSTAVNLKLHAAAMGHEMPAGLEDVGDANTASVMNVICAPNVGNDDDVADLVEPEEDAGYVNGKATLQMERSWVKGSTEIKKRKQGSGNNDEIVVLDDDDEEDTPRSRPKQSFANGPPPKVAKMSAPSQKLTQSKASPKTYVGTKPKPVTPNSSGSRTSCPVCPKGSMNVFTSPSHLLIHMRVAHRDSPGTTNGRRSSGLGGPPNIMKKQRPISQRPPGNNKRPPASNSDDIEVIDLV